MKRIFIPQLTADEVNPILKMHRFRLPKNVHHPVARWHHGNYYGYGNKDSWFPLNELGGIATYAFHDMTVRFPKPIDEVLTEIIWAREHPRLAKRKARLATQ